MPVSNFVMQHMQIETHMLQSATPCPTPDADIRETALAILAGEVVQICGGPGMFKHWTRDLDGETIVVGRAEIVAIQQRIGVPIALRQDPHYPMQMQLYFQAEPEAREWIVNVSSTAQTPVQTRGE